jgi:hypothetical protein
MSFKRAFDGAIQYGLANASPEGARIPQAIYNVSDIMLAATPQDLVDGNYEIVVADLNVRGWLVGRADMLCRDQKQDSICGAIGENIAAFFRDRDCIDWVYGGLRPSGINQLVMHFLSRSLARNSKILRVRSIHSFGETFRRILRMIAFAAICRMPRLGKREAEGLWYLLDEEYMSPSETLLSGLNRDLSLRFYDSYFFLYALACKDAILERLLSKIHLVGKGRPRIRFRHHHRVAIEEVLRCFEPISSRITPSLIVRSLLTVRAFKLKHNLSSHIYVKGFGKPILISLDSLPCVLLLRKLLTKWDAMGLTTIRISNMDPPNERLWLRDTDGPHTSEFRVLMIRQE